MYKMSEKGGEYCSNSAVIATKGPSGLGGPGGPVGPVGSVGPVVEGWFKVNDV